MSSRELRANASRSLASGANASRSLASRAAGGDPQAGRARLRIDVITLFPGMFEGVFGASIIARARAAGLVDIGFVNPRDFAPDRHRKVDDRPFGGGPGMVMMAEPIFRAVQSLRRPGAHVVLLCPQGRTFDARAAAGLVGKKHIVLVCGHYEGIDERLRSVFDDEISVGDYVLTGGEIPAMAVVDAVTRLVPGVLKKDGAAAAESFESPGGEGPRLDHPHYTRPRVWRGRKVPAALLSGDHGLISGWRRKAAAAATKARRPDLCRAASAGNGGASKTRHGRNGKGNHRSLNLAGQRSAKPGEASWWHRRRRSRTRAGRSRSSGRATRSG